MSRQPENEHSDPIEALTNLRPTPERDPQAAARGRANFLFQAEQEKAKLPVSIGLFERLNHWMQRMQPKRLALRTLTVSTLLVVFFFSGTSLTAYASQNALPGETLYPVKLWLEETQLQLTTNPAKDLELHLNFAQERLNEMEQMVAQNQNADLDGPSANFYRHVQKAEELLAQLNNNEAFSSKLDQTLERYEQYQSENELPGDQEATPAEDSSQPEEEDESDLGDDEDSPEEDQDDEPSSEQDAETEDDTLDQEDLEDADSEEDQTGDEDEDGEQQDESDEVDEEEEETEEEDEEEPESEEEDEEESSNNDNETANQSEQEDDEIENDEKNEDEEV